VLDELDDSLDAGGGDGNAESEEMMKLVRLAQGGDKAAWNDLFALLEPRINSMCFRQGSRYKQDSSDLAQQTWMSILRDLQTFKGGTDRELVSWVRTIVSHRAVDLARRERKDPVVSIDQTTQGGGHIRDCLPGKGTSPSGWLLGKERREILRRKLSSLPPIHREVLELRYFRRMEIKDIAKRLEINRNAVDARISRAVEALRRRMDGTI
jgi:RNA polymerase sigma-70 factor (ECF subfamily)